MERGRESKTHVVIHVVRDDGFLIGEGIGEG